MANETTVTNNSETPESVDEGTEVVLTDSEKESLGDPGRRALQAEREKVRAEKARSRELEQRVAELEGRAEHANEADDAVRQSLSRIEALERELGDYKAREAEAERRADVVARKKVPAEWADLVSGGSVEEMERVADKILDNLNGGYVPRGHGPLNPDGDSARRGSIESGYMKAQQRFNPTHKEQ